MEKSIYTPKQLAFAKLLRETRKTAGLTQVELAEKLRTTQSIVSKWERGELRLDFVQVYGVCEVLGTTLPAFAVEFERRLRTKGGKRSAR
jgi:transcriptional regulator with XRE-family HTH domain